MSAVLVSGSSNEALASQLAQTAGLTYGERVLDRFPDGELRIRLTTKVAGRKVVLVQSLVSPVGEHALELLLLADACRRAGAQELIGVIPYVGYARQDRVTVGGAALGAKIIAELLAPARFSVQLVVDLHSPVFASCEDTPVVHLTAMKWMAEALAPYITAETTLVSPDIGAMKMVEAYSAALKVPLAIVHKMRLSGSEVRSRGLIGELKGRRAVLIDDMISTGATLKTAVEEVRAHGAVGPVIIAATHGLFVDGALARLTRPDIERVVVTDSVPLSQPLPAHVHRVSLAPLLAEAVQRILCGEPVDELLATR